MLREPGPHGLHAPWARACAREGSAGSTSALLDAVMPERGYRPDFMTPPPESPRRWSSRASSRACARRRPRRSAASSAGRSPAGGCAGEGAARRSGGGARRAGRADGGVLGTSDRAVAGSGSSRRWRRTSPTAHAGSRRAGRSRRSPISTRACAGATGAVEVEQQYDAEVELAGRGLLLVPGRVRLARACGRCSIRRGSRRSSTRRAGSARCGSRPGARDGALRRSSAGAARLAS